LRDRFGGCLYNLLRLGLNFDPCWHGLQGWRLLPFRVDAGRLRRRTHTGSQRFSGKSEGGDVGVAAPDFHHDAWATEILFWAFWSLRVGPMSLQAGRTGSNQREALLAYSFDRACGYTLVAFAPVTTRKLIRQRGAWARLCCCGCFYLLGYALLRSARLRIVSYIVRTRRAI